MRRFPPIWTVEQIPGGYKVKDANGQALAYVYARETRADAAIANVLTMDEARRIASNIAKLPTLGQATFFLSELPGPGRAPSAPFDTNDRTFKGVMRSTGG